MAQKTTLTETYDDINSVEVTRDSKGAFKYTIKWYFDPENTDEAIDKIDYIYSKLVEKFEPGEKE
jgi:hypothetical protein